MFLQISSIVISEGFQIFNSRILRSGIISAVYQTDDLKLTSKLIIHLHIPKSFLH